MVFVYHFFAYSEARMLVNPFQPLGKRNHASFRVVLQETHQSPGHRHVEILGQL